jgi:hypothetical protein
VIVTDCMDSWPARSLWTADYFVKRFGSYKAQIYNDLFDLLDTTSISNYIKNNFDQPACIRASEYVRWYVRFKEFDFPFPWADEAFHELEEDWGTPSFFPTSEFVLPYCSTKRLTFAHLDVFPYKGLFISGRGARTRLHRDPFGTDAILCQFVGEKRIQFYHPQDQEKLCKGGAFFDPDRPDLVRFPRGKEAKPVFTDVLKPGQVLFIPSGWFHDVVTEVDSVSITWNFVHSARSSPFIEAIRDPTNHFDHDMIAYFFAQAGEPISELRDVEVALSRLAAREQSTLLEAKS